MSVKFSPFSNKTVLITGASGFVGSALVRALVSDCPDVHILIRTNSQLEGLTSVMEKVKCHIVQLDEPDALHKLNYIKPHFVFHLAQPSHLRLTDMQGYLSSKQIALNMLTNVLDYARSNGVQKVIHACGSTIYQEGHKTFTEASTPLEPSSFRGKIKLAERALCLHYARKFDLPVVLGRIFRAYGPYDSASKLIVKSLEAFVNKEPLKVTEQPFKRDYVHVRDISTALLKLSLADTGLFDEFNIGCGVQYTALEVVKVLNEILPGEIEISHQFYPGSAMDKVYWGADMQKCLNQLNWQPGISLNEGLTEVTDWYLNQPVGR